MAAVIPILADESNVVFVYKLLTIFNIKIILVFFISWYTQAIKAVSISHTRAIFFKVFLGFCVLLVHR
jgi:hypothetical protein